MDSNGQRGTTTSGTETRADHSGPRKTRMECRVEPPLSTETTLRARKSRPKFWSNLHRLAALSGRSCLIQGSVFLIDRKSVAATAELAEHYRADTNCLQTRVVLKEIGLILILGEKHLECARSDRSSFHNILVPKLKPWASSQHRS